MSWSCNAKISTLMSMLCIPYHSTTCVCLPRIRRGVAKEVDVRLNRTVRTIIITSTVRSTPYVMSIAEFSYGHSIHPPDIRTEKYSELSQTKRTCPYCNDRSCNEKAPEVTHPVAVQTHNRVL